jgi:hypothetical protein
MKSIACASLGLLLIGTGLTMLGGHRQAGGHCQVPCGIYDDAARIQALLEDTTTIEKAVAEISRLSKEHSALDINQAIRWVNTKDAHASHVIETVSEYFLTQKVKEVAPGSADYQKYLQSLGDHHLVMRAAMKTKQTVDPADVEALKSAINKMAEHYHAH